MSSVGGDIRAKRGDEGAAAVEFALVSMIFVLLLTGIIQFGFTFFEYIQVAHAAREGARWAALGETGQVTARAIAAAPGLEAGRLQIVLTSGSSLDSVRVTVTYPRTQIVPIPDVALPLNITSVAEMREE